jgi:tetratricopeptide (TPR) repeat protein
MSVAAEHEMPAFDSLWDYSLPATSEARFRTLLPQIEVSGDAAILAELLTQIARAQGLQQKFEDARATLDQADALIQPNMTTARVRSLLERGRWFNSSKKPAESVPLFQEALKQAQEAGLEFYAVDAAHMLGIVTKDDDSLRWNEEAVKIAESAKLPRTRRWLGPLYNNTGWTYFDMKRYSDALRLFEKDIEYRKQLERPVEMGIAEWSRAKMLRHLGRVDEALKVQLDLLERPERKGNASEGYTREEVGECLLLLKRQDEAAPHFGRAWELLHEDPWLKRDESARLERLKELGGK